MAALDALFAEARAAHPDPDAALTARVMADALAIDAARRVPPRAAPQGGLAALWRALTAAFGGATPVAGMATAAAVGLWVGFAAPAPVAAFAPGLLLQGEAADLDLIPDVLTLIDPLAEM
jgi:hypothetical protein